MQARWRKKHREWKESSVVCRKPIKVVPRTIKKSLQPQCELCDKTATLSCPLCTVTFYCSKEHYESDLPTHGDRCETMKFIRRPEEFSANADDRIRWKRQRVQRMEELYTHTHEKGVLLLKEGEYDKAIPIATNAAKFAVQVFGDSIQLMAALIVVASCHIHKFNIGIAETYLSQALRLEINLPEKMTSSMKAQIREVEGLIWTAKGAYEMARDCFAEEIYQFSEDFGPMHIVTSAGYCYLGLVFFKMRCPVVAASHFRQTVDIWYQFTDALLEDMQSDSHIPILAGVIAQEKIWIEDKDAREGLKILKKALSLMNETGPGVTTLDLVRASYTIGVIYYLSHRPHEAKNYCLEGIMKIKSDDLNSDPINKKLSELFKFCARKISRVPSDVVIPEQDFFSTLLDFPVT